MSTTGGIDAPVASSSKQGRAQTPTKILGPPSRRWTHFSSALQLAIQRAAHKWTYEEFAECFELWCQEQPDGATGVYNAVSLHMESVTTKTCNELFANYNARENIDTLHAVVTEARERQSAGEVPGPDTWKSDLEPRAATRARTIPIFKDERDRLKVKLEELEKENLELQAQMRENYEEWQFNDGEEARRLDDLDKIMNTCGSLPLEDIQEFTLRTTENLVTESAS